MRYFVIVTAILAAFACDGDTTSCPISCYCRDVPNDDEIPPTTTSINDHLESAPEIVTFVTCTKKIDITYLPKTTNRLQITTITNVSLQNLLDNLTNAASQHLPYLTALSLSGCSLFNLNNVSIFSLQFLRTLDLSHNLLTEIPQSVISADSNVTELQTLDLSCNRIQTITDYCLSELPNLRTLNLSANRISNLSTCGFVGLQKLEYLDLSSNNLSAIGDNVFSQISELQYLNLSNNKLETLEGECFSRLTHLQQLDVSRNQLTSVEPSALQALPSLARLTLAGNPHLGDLLVGTGRRLQAVDASRTGLAHVPPALTRSVRTLRLAGNAIHTVRCGDLDSYPLLKLLDFAANGLENIEDDALGRLDTLFTLYLSENHLRQVPKSLPTSLKILHLERNKIERLAAGQLNGLINLEVLLLSDNDINTFEEGAFDNLTSLITLDISGNPLIALASGMLMGPTKLQVLRLAGLPVANAARDTTFPVHAIERLISLDLTASPGLARMLLADTAALSAAKYLQELSLADAGLIHIRNDLLQFLPQLRSLRLNGNRLDCSGLLWLAQWMRQQNREEDGTVFCAAPPDLAGTLLIDLQEGDIIDVVVVTQTPTTSTTTATQPTTFTTSFDDNLISVSISTDDSSTPLSYVTEKHSMNSTVASSSGQTEIFDSTMKYENNITTTPTLPTSPDTSPDGGRNRVGESIQVVNKEMGKPTTNTHINNIGTTSRSSEVENSVIVENDNAITFKTTELASHPTEYPNRTKTIHIQNSQGAQHSINKNKFNNNNNNITISSVFQNTKNLTTKKLIQKNITTHHSQNNSTAATKYPNQSFHPNETTNSKILRDLFVAFEPIKYNQSKLLKLKSLGKLEENLEPKLLLKHIRTTTTTTKPEIKEPEKFATRLKTVSEPKFILSPDIKTDYATSIRSKDIEIETDMKTGEIVSMYRSSTSGATDLKQDLSQHPSLVIFVISAIGTLIAVVLIVAKWSRRRRHLPSIPIDMIRNTAAMDHDGGGIEVNQLPNVTDLW